MDNYIAINWNSIEDMIDKMTWEKLTEQFWLDTRIPLSNDLDDWRTLSLVEQDMVAKVFGGLTLLDTLQSESGIDAIRKDITTKHEEAVLNNIQFMESVHAKSYSSIFSTLNTKSEIDEIFAWVNSNELLQCKARTINDIYKNGSPLQKKAASVMLESFLFYSGFYEFQIGFNKLSEKEQGELKNWVYGTIYDLYNNECKFTQEIYDKLGWTEKVKAFIRYNANKALQNLGFESLFPDSADDVDPIVMNGISTGTSNHDFFSQVGNGYLLGAVEAMDDEDYVRWMPV